MTLMTDLYPSRGETPVALQARLDPVFYGDPATPSGPLSRGEISQYETNGFLFFESFLSPDEVALYAEELERLRHDPSIRKREDVFLEPRDGGVRSIFNVHRNAPLFQQLAQDGRILDRVRQILHGPVYIHQSRINYKPGFTGKEFYWHSDFETWHAEDGMPRMRALSCSIALTENNECNGSLMIIPGSHRLFVPCRGQTPENHYKVSLKKQEYGVPDPDSLNRLVERGGIFSAKGPPGSMVLFECNAMHGSNGNISPWARSNIFFVYNSVENSLAAPFCGLDPRPEFIASRDFTPLAFHATSSR